MKVSRHAKVIRICLLTVLCLPVIHLQAATARAAEGLAWEGIVAEGDVRPLFVDHVRRRLYAMEPGDVVAEFDLDAAYGKMLIRKKALPMEAGGLADNTVAPDLAGRRAFVADHDVTGTSCPTCSSIHILDLRSLEFTLEWNVYERFPNFHIQGMTYSEDDQRLYVVGVAAGSGATVYLDWAGEPLLPVSVIAIDVRTGHLAWFRHLSKCLRPMTSFAGGSHIFRSRQSNALYLGCARADLVTFGTSPLPGAAGVLRLWIAPNADQQAALLFREEFFRASGSFFALTGPIARAAFDYATERFIFVTSSYSTPGAWVFDGAMSSWVGFIPTKGSQNNGLGIDPATGRMFLRDGRADTGLLVTDVRTTPVPQGDAIGLSSPRESFNAHTGLYATDAATRRIFLVVGTFDPQTGKTSGLSPKLVAFRDQTPLTPPDTSPDYDALTSDVPEGTDTMSTFAGAAKGFGARAFLVGGTGGLTSPARSADLTASTYARVIGDAIAPADRGLWAARVSSIDLRNVGGTADAQAVVLDDVTNDQRRSAQRDGANAGVPDTAVSKLDWPWPAAFCLDSGEQPATESPPSPSGQARVACDLKGQTVSASVQAGAVHSGGISIGAAGFTGSSVRRAGAGVEVDSVATAHGIEIEVPGTGTLRIGDVRQRVNTQAGGRPGTARVRWEPSIEGVHVLDASGRTVFACAENCDPREVASHVNEVFSLVMRMRIPDSERIATPRGAFAAFRETTPNYVNDLVMNNDASRAVPAVQLEIYNDWADKSRLVLQLAAVESSAIYGISSTMAAAGTGEAPGPIGQPPVALPQPGVVEPPSYPGSQIPAFPASSVAVPPSSVVQRVLRTALFAVRSPRDALSMALILMLFGGALALGARRGSLVKLLSRQHAT